MAIRKGEAGSGLTDDDAVKEFGENAAVGSFGEKQFKGILASSGLLDIYDTWFSVKVPDKTGTRKEKTDVDVVISSGRTLILLDVKRWSSSEYITTSSGGKKRRPIHYWTIPFAGLPMKNFTPLRKDGKIYDKGLEGGSRSTGQKQWALSRSMEMARDRFSSLLPGYRVISIVVFVPTTERGEGPASVGLLKWPGGIRSYSSGDSLRFIRKTLGPSARTGKEAEALLSRMTYSRN